MSRYGKALSVYKRINNIKRASENINQARLQIGEQSAKARRAAQDAAFDNEVLSGAVNLGSQILAGGLHNFNLINRNEAQWGSAVAGAIGTTASQIATQENDIAGLSAEEAQATGISLTDAMNQSLTNYNIQDRLSDRKFRNERDEFLESNGGVVEYDIEPNEEFAELEDDDLRLISQDSQVSEEEKQAALNEIQRRNAVQNLPERSFAQRSSYLDEADEYGKFKRGKGYVFDGFDEGVIKDRFNSYVDAGNIELPEEEMTRFERLMKMQESLTNLGN